MLKNPFSVLFRSKEKEKRNPNEQQSKDSSSSSLKNKQKINPFSDNYHSVDYFTEPSQINDKSIYSDKEIRDSALKEAESILQNTLNKLLYPQSSIADRYYNITESSYQNDFNSKTNLASRPEIKWCLDEIITEATTPTKLCLPSEIDNFLSEKINLEYERYINLFDFPTYLHQDLMQLLVKGDVAYECIYGEKESRGFGLLGITRLNPTCYSLGFSKLLNNGFVCNIDLNKTFRSQFSNFSDGFNVSSTPLTSNIKYDKETDTFQTDKSHLVLNYPNVIVAPYYVNPITNEIMSLLDYAFEPYVQLKCIQEAALVMRITRSPERLLFNVDTSGMADKVASEFIRKFANALSKRKIPTGGQSGIGNVYNPSTMLESWVFGKTNNSSGTTVSTVASTANFNQLDDVEYFQNRLLGVFKIPTNRFHKPGEITYTNSNNITFDELRFFKFVSEIQNKISSAITQNFIYDLNVRGILNESDAKLYGNKIKIEFEKPAQYETFLSISSFKEKYDVFKELVDSGYFSRRILMRQILGMTDSEINSHFSEIENEKKQDLKLEHSVEEFGKSIGKDDDTSDFSFNNKEENLDSLGRQFRDMDSNKDMRTFLDDSSEE